jgi:hypothetical protein
VAVLAALVRESPRRAPVRGGYRVVLRDRAFVHLAEADVAMIAVGWGVFSWLLPPFARDQIGLGTALIGLLMMVNALTVVVAQVPVARFAEGRRRGRYMAVVGLCFWIGLAAAPTGGTALPGVSPVAAFGLAAVVALAAAVSMLRLERRLPEAARLTPRPRRG